MIKFGTAIKKYREKARMTQVILSGKLDIESTYLSAIENGKKDPSIGLLRRISKTLGIPPEVLFWESVEIDKKIAKEDLKTIELARVLVKYYYKCI